MGKGRLLVIAMLLAVLPGLTGAGVAAAGPVDLHLAAPATPWQFGADGLKFPLHRVTGARAAGAASGQGNLSARQQAASAVPSPATASGSSCNGTWQTIPSPTGPGDDGLNATSGTSARDVWAVGSASPSPGMGPDSTLAEHFDGTGWNVVATPNGSASFDNALEGAAAIGKSDVWAVGAYVAGFVSTTPVAAELVEHYDGSAWAVVPTPNVGPGGSGLNSVSALGSNDVWAVGFASNSARHVTLIEHWNGTGWSKIPSPNAGAGNNTLFSVAAIAANDVWAVGADRTTNAPGAELLTLVLHWNGVSWAQVASPNQVLAPGQINVLAAVSGSAGNDVWAVGAYSRPADGAAQTLSMHWNGSGWTIVPTPNPGNDSSHPGGNSLMVAIEASAPNDTWAVGTWAYVLPTSSTTPIYHTLAVHWDGVSWSGNQLDVAGNTAELDGVSGLGVVWAVGAFNFGTGRDTTLTAVCSPPTVVSLTPSGGSTAGGTSVVIRGSGFGIANGVRFGSTAAASFSVDSDSQITTVTPAEPPGTVDVTITYAGGSSAMSAADQFTFVTPTVPTAPSNVVALGSEASATVYWSPGSDGFSPITSFTLTASPGAITMTVPGSARSAVMTGLSDGTTYTITVTATNAVGNSPVSAPSNPVTPGGGAYQPLTPFRIFDTRVASGRGQPSPLGPGQAINVQVAGQGGVPASGAVAVVMNVTATNTTTPGYLTLYPAGVPRPLASSLNWAAGATVPNLVELPLGVNGQISVYNAAGNADVIFDVAGYVSASAGTAAPAGDLYQPMVPTRVVDTRDARFGGPAPVGPGRVIRVMVAPVGQDAAVLNVTITNPTAASYLTVWPDGQVQPVASNLNFTAGQTVANRIQVKAGSNGFVDIFNAAGSVDVVVDLNGRFIAGASHPTGGSLFVGVTPTRIVDTRSTPTSLGPNICLPVQVGGGGVVPANATAVVANVTVTDTSAASYLTAFPDGAGQPLASDLNWIAGDTRANLAVVQLGPNGRILLCNAAGTTDVVIDVVGYYA